MEDKNAQTQAELEAILGILTELTGLPSRWSGSVELVPNAEFKGRKPFRCDIEINAALAEQDERWPTLIHEALHSISAGYFRDDYQDFQGWEEGTVEQLQRFYRPRVLSRLGLSIAPHIFEPLDAEHGYNIFIAALETIREAQNISVSDAESFYLDLLTTPLKERPSRVARYGFTLLAPQRQDFFTTVSAASAILRTRRR